MLKIMLAYGKGLILSVYMSGVEQLDRCIIDVSLRLGTIVAILSSSPVEIS